jgi:uncharacterized membrane protein
MHDPHELWTFLDRAVSWSGEPPRDATLAAAQAEFQQRTGEYEAGRSWYEERIRLFHDWFLLDHVLPTGRVGLAEFLHQAGPRLPEEQRTVYRGLLAASHRSLFEVDRSRAARLRLLDRIGGTVYDLPAAVAPAGLVTCDLLDARLLRPDDGEPLLARGLLVHPRQAHQAILELVETARRDADGPPWELPDALARMKVAWDRADNPRVPAIYGPGSYLYREFIRALPRPAPDGA